MAAGVQTLCRDARKHAAVRQRLIGAVFCAVALTSCGEQETLATEDVLTEIDAVMIEEQIIIDPDDLAEIAKAIAYHQGLINFCGGEPSTRSEMFMEEVVLSSLPTEAVERAIDVSMTTLAEFEEAEAEYVCTPEMFEQLGGLSDDALAKWNEVKGGE